MNKAKLKRTARRYVRDSGGRFAPVPGSGVLAQLPVRVRRVLAFKAQAIKRDETGATAERVVAKLLESVDDKTADLLYEKWDDILDEL